MKRTAVLVALGSIASAQVIISTSGQFASNAPAGPYFAPNGNWTLSFRVSNPPPVVFSISTTFQTTYSNGVYTVNGTPITLTGSQVNFDTGDSFGICLDAPCNYGFSSLSGTPKVFSGATASPTILLGSYSQGGTLNIRDALQNINSTSTATPLVIAAAPIPSTPAPATFLLTGIGFAVVVFVVTKRRRECNAVR
jgi:hypothetical protein